MKETLDGTIRVPRFRHELRWTKESVRKLLDSIYHHYPVGSLVFWVHRADQASLELGSISIEAPETTEALWIIDGQQRVQALVRSLAGAGAPLEPFALLFDLDDRQIVLPHKGHDRRTVLPVEKLLDSKLLFDWLLEHPELTKTQRASAIDASERIRDYQIPTCLVRTEDETIVREIFTRLNTTGAPMTLVEILDAALGGHSDEESASFRAASLELESAGFGRIDERDVCRMALAAEGNESLESIRGESISGSGTLMESIVPIALRVIDFLRNDGGIPHRDLLPYSSPLNTLARFFRLHPEPSPRSRELLARWLWRGGISGDAAHARKGVAAVDSDEHASVQRILSTVTKTPCELTPARRWSPNFAACRIESLVLLALSPVDLRDGRRLLPDTATTLEGWALRPEPLMVDASTDGLAARYIHPPVDEEGWELLQNASPEALMSHGVPPSARDAIARADASALEAERGRHLTAWRNEFLARRAQWEPADHDRPPLTHLAARGSG